jgi:transposase
MAFRKGDRHQSTLFPPSLEELVPEDSPVRVYNAFVDALDIKELGINTNENQVGNPSYDPRAMLKLLIYGYSYGVRSSRKLEREVHNNISFIWLMGGLKPDHKTIAEFRRNNKKALQNVLKASARMCIKFDLIAGNTLFVDGSKFRANASIKNSRSDKQCKRDLEKVEKRIEEILHECDTIDESESNQPNFVKIKEELADQQILKEKINEFMREMNTSRKKSYNSVDPDCTKVRSKQGINSGYNAQIVVDEKNGLIVSNDVVGESNDPGQLSSQVDQAHETLGKQSETVCADAGYARMEELEKAVNENKDVKVIVPSLRQAADIKKEEFDKEYFKYDEENDCYICPAGYRLTKRGYRKTKRGHRYQIEQVSYCRNCEHFGKCTKAKEGRSILRNVNEKLREELEAEYLKEESQEVYKLRQQRVEHPFGHIKRNLGADHFLLRRRDGVRAEMSLLSTCFNLRRMITLIGLNQIIELMQKQISEGVA